MTEIQPPTDEQIIDAWLATTPEQIVSWQAAHQLRFSCTLVERFKARSDQYVLSKEPEISDRLIDAARLVAQTLPEQPLAQAFVDWAQGNSLLFKEPAQAIIFYKRALEICQTLRHVQFVVDLLGNLLGAVCEIGDFEAARRIHQEITAWEPYLETEDHNSRLVRAQNYALFLHDIGDYQNALQAHNRARQLADEFQENRRFAEIDVNCALTLARLGRLAESERLLLQSRPLAEANADALTVARIDMNLGEIYTAQARPAEALRYLYAAQRQFANLNNRMEVGSVLLREASLLEQIGAYGEANRCYRQAQAQFTDYGMSPQVGLALLGGAITDRLYGRYDRARKLLNQAELLWQELQQPDYLMLIDLEQIALTFAQSDATAALEVLHDKFTIPPDQATFPHHFTRYWLLTAELYTALAQTIQTTDPLTLAYEAYTQALNFGEVFQDRQTRREALVGLARLLRQRDKTLAYHFLEQAQEQDDLIRQALSVQELKASFLRRVNTVQPLLALLAHEQGKPQQALTHIWRAKGDALFELLQATYLAGKGEQEGDNELDEQLTALRQRLAALSWQAQQDKLNDKPESMAEDTLPEIQQLKYRLQELRRQRNIQIGATSFNHATDPGVVLARMEADLLIEYFESDEQLYAICADRHGKISFYQLAAIEQVMDLQDELHFAFGNFLKRTPTQQTTHLHQELAEIRPLLAQCYALLLKPLGELPAAGRLLISPCDALSDLPFAALWNQQHYLVQEYELEFIPTGALLATLSTNTSTGPPVVVAASAEGRLAAVHAEAISIQQSFPEALCLVDNPSTVDHLQSIASAPRFLHIAAHTATSDIPIFTALHFAGALLSVEQCYELPLQGTEFVALSGCNTGLNSANNEVLLALQSAFMVAGAQRVISTLRPIDDAASSEFMSQFYRLLASGALPPAALCDTQRLLITDNLYSHPVFWAPFVCYRR